MVISKRRKEENSMKINEMKEQMRETEMMENYKLLKPFSSFLLCMNEPSFYELVDYLYFEIAFHILCISN
jgi:hypothetical protein